MFGLTSLGVIHTVISLVAVAAGLVAFFRDKRIVATNTTGRVYIWATVLTCVTGFGIFQHGGFGKPHMLGIITLVVLAVAALAGRRKLFGGPFPPNDWFTFGKVWVSSMQTFVSRIDKYAATGGFDLVCIDEAHRSRCQTYETIVHRLQEANRK
jgi:hypothetical protein